MGATPSHEDDGGDVADPDDSDEDDIIKIQNNRRRVSRICAILVIYI